MTTRPSRAFPPEYLIDQPWRVGRKVGRTVYAIVGDVPSDDDPLIGVMDFEELAVAVVAVHNAWWRAQEPKGELGTTPD